jgi:hypothetical protein
LSCLCTGGGMGVHEKLSVFGTAIYQQSISDRSSTARRMKRSPELLTNSCSSSAIMSLTTRGSTAGRCNVNPAFAEQTKI